MAKIVADDFRFGAGSNILDSALTGPGITPSFGSLSRLSRLVSQQEGIKAIPGMQGSSPWISANSKFGPVSGDSEFGLNMDTGKLALSGLATIGNLYAAFQANKLAKKQFNFSRDADR